MNEHTEQARVIEWARTNEFICPELCMLFSTLNGIPLLGINGRMRAIIINRMKAEGMKNGVPDLLFFVARKGYHGLVIEMKVNDNKPSKEQTSWLDKMHEQGYLAVACWGADESKQVIADYLDRKDLI